MADIEGLAEALAATGKSNDAIARDVLARWERAEPGSKKPDVRSIGAKVGKLRRGDRRWWRGKPGAARALAEILGLHPDDVLGVASAPDDGTLRFHDWPELPPMEAGERRSRVSHVDLVELVRDRLHHQRPTWIVVPPGCGKTLVIRALGRRDQELSGQYDVLLDLARSGEGPADRRIVAEVRRRDPKTDKTAFVELSHRNAATIVLAAYGPPPVDHGNAAETWKVIHWSLENGWRRRFVSWCLGRLPAGELDQDEVCRWLDDIDPAGDLISSPGSLLPLLRWAHQHGIPTHTSLGEASDALVRERVASVGDRRVPPDRASELLRHLVLHAVDALIQGKHLATASDWADLLPAQPPTRRIADDVLHEVEALHAARTKAQKDQHRVALTQLLHLDTGDAFVEALVSAELLVEADVGFAIYPRWVHDAFKRDVIAAETGPSNWAVWGRWASHPLVRPIVVETLVALERQALLRTIDRVLDGAGPTLSHAAAVEALFEAAAFRLDPDTPEQARWKPSAAQARTLGRLGLAQAELTLVGMRARDDSFPSRLTAAPDRWSAEAVLWLARAWSFSLAVPPPEDAPGEATWLLPGWYSAFDHELWLPILDASRQPDEESWWAYGALVNAARRLVREKPSAAQNEAWAPQVAALIEGTERPVALAGEVMRGRGSEILAWVVSGEADDVRSRAATAIWTHLDQAPGVRVFDLTGNPLLRLGRAPYAAVRDLLLNDLPEAVFISDLAPETVVAWLRVEPQKLTQLPLRLRSTLLAEIAPALVAAENTAFLRIEDAVRDLDDPDLLAILAGVSGVVGDAAAARMWAMDADRALNELEVALGVDGHAFGRWVATCPVEHAHAVATLVLQIRETPGAGVRRWLAMQVATGSVHAPKMYELLTRLDSTQGG